MPQTFGTTGPCARTLALGRHNRHDSRAAPRGTTRVGMSATPHLSNLVSEPSVGTSEDAPFRLVDPSFRGIARLIGIVVACAIALYLCWRVRGVLRLEAIAVFLALSLNP